MAASIVDHSRRPGKRVRLPAGRRDLLVFRGEAGQDGLVA